MGFFSTIKRAYESVIDSIGSRISSWRSLEEDDDQFLDEQEAKTTVAADPIEDWDNYIIDLEAIESELSNVSEYLSSEELDFLLGEGYDPDALSAITILDSAPFGFSLRYEFADAESAVGWTADIGAPAYFAVVYMDGMWQVWEDKTG